MLNSSNVIHPNTHNSGPLTSEVATSGEAAGQVLGTAKPGATQGAGLPSLPQLGQGEQLGDSTGISHPIPAHPCPGKAPVGWGIPAVPIPPALARSWKWQSQLFPFVHWERESTSPWGQGGGKKGPQEKLGFFLENKKILLSCFPQVF